MHDATCVRESTTTFVLESFVYSLAGNIMQHYIQVIYPSVVFSTGTVAS